MDRRPNREEGRNENTKRQEITFKEKGGGEDTVLAAGIYLTWHSFPGISEDNGRVQMWLCLLLRKTKLLKNNSWTTLLIFNRRWDMESFDAELERPYKWHFCWTQTWAFLSQSPSQSSPLWQCRQTLLCFPKHEIFRTAYLLLTVNEYPESNLWGFWRGPYSARSRIFLCYTVVQKFRDLLITMYRHRPCPSIMIYIWERIGMQFLFTHKLVEQPHLMLQIPVVDCKRYGWLWFSGYLLYICNRISFLPAFLKSSLIRLATNVPLLALL